MRLRRLAAIAAASVAMAIPAVAATGPANASGGHVAAAKRLPPAVQICNQRVPPLCFNTQGGSHNYGTFITGFDKDDVHGTFEPITLSGRCNNGHVDAATNCPFTDPAIDAALNNDRIMMIENYEAGWCAGTASATTYTLQLRACPSIDGTGGDWATQWVWNGAGSVYNCLINVQKTNANPRSDHAEYGAISNGRSGGISIATGVPQPNCSPSALWKEFT